MDAENPQAGRAKSPATILTRYPRWFTTLFLTDIWERFSFYGMQAILVLWAAAPESEGGLGLPESSAAALFGVYIGTAFVLAMAGGWIGDRLLGEQRAVLWGGVVVAAGHFSMAVPALPLTIFGLILIAAGTGLLKPNLSALLGRFYGSDRSVEREAAFSVFYMSIQVSALIAPLVTGFLGETVDWHLGFGAAGVGMTFGVIQYAAGRRHFGDVGARPARRAAPAEVRRVSRYVTAVTVVAAVVVTADVVSGSFSPDHLIIPLGRLIMLAAPIAFTAMMRRPDLDAADRQRMKAFLWLFLVAAVFWMLVGQTGSLLNLFAERSTDRAVLGATVPASWFQSATPLFVLITAPLFALVFVRLGLGFTVRWKFVLGMACSGLSFLVMAAAALLAAGGDRVSPLWLLAVFLLHACGELALGPVGLSAAADAAPQRYRVQMLGLWWLFCAMGVGIGSQTARLSDVLEPSVYYLALGVLALAAGAALAVSGGRISRVLAYSTAAVPPATGARAAGVPPAEAAKSSSP